MIAQFLRALGVARHAVARDEAERICQYRSLLATRRMLIVLDDALDANQVRPLIPGSGSCGTLVTSRRCLTDLSEARLSLLAEMPDAEAREVLQVMVGAERVGQEPAAVSSVVAACAGVPLALCIAGARLAARPSWPIGHLARLLADDRHRLDELAYGSASVRASLEAAYRALGGAATGADISATDAFRLLGRWRSAQITSADAAVPFGLAGGERDQRPGDPGRCGPAGVAPAGQLPAA